MKLEKIPLLRKSPSLNYDSASSSSTTITTTPTKKKISYLEASELIHIHDYLSHDTAREEVHLLHVCKNWRSILLNHYDSSKSIWMMYYENAYESLLSVDELLYNLHYEIQVQNNFYRQEDAVSDDEADDKEQIDVFHIDQFYRKHKRKESDGINYFDEFLRIKRRFYSLTAVKKEKLVLDYHKSFASHLILLLTVPISCILWIVFLILVALSFGYNEIMYPTNIVSAILTLLAILFSFGLCSLFTSEKYRRNGVLTKRKTWLQNGYDGTILYWLNICCTISISFCILLVAVLVQIQMRLFNLSWSILLTGLYPIGLLITPIVFTIPMIICHRLFIQTMTPVLQERIRKYAYCMAFTVGVSWLPILTVLLIPGLYLNLDIEHVYSYIMIAAHFSDLLLIIGCICLTIISHQQLFKYLVAVPLLLQSLIFSGCVIFVHATWNTLGSKTCLIFIVPMSTFSFQCMIIIYKVLRVIHKPTK
jgi:hypothetical protein